MVWSMMTAPVMASVTSPTEFSAHTLTMLGFPEINRKYNQLSISTYINKACNLIFEVTACANIPIYLVCQKHTCSVWGDFIISQEARQGGGDGDLFQCGNVIGVRICSHSEPPSDDLRLSLVVMPHCGQGILC